MKEATRWRPHTFEQAVEYLQEGHYIDYEVSIGGHHGALMTCEVWLEEVKTFGFMDEDGYGLQLTVGGKNIECISPSQADLISPDTAYILWYNK